jgi:hypothetical protein
MYYSGQRPVKSAPDAGFRGSCFNFTDLEKSIKFFDKEGYSDKFKQDFINLYLTDRFIENTDTFDHRNKSMIVKKEEDDNPVDIRVAPNYDFEFCALFERFDKYVGKPCFYKLFDMFNKNYYYNRLEKIPHENLRFLRNNYAELLWQFQNSLDKLNSTEFEKICDFTCIDPKLSKLSEDVYKGQLKRAAELQRL